MSMVFAQAGESLEMQDLCAEIKLRWESVEGIKETVLSLHLWMN